MGSIISKYYDDVEEYEYLCKKYGEKVREVYSKHHRWLQEKNNGSELSFDKYLKREKIEQLKFEIKNKLSKLSQLKEEIVLEKIPLSEEGGLEKYSKWRREDFISGFEEALKTIKAIYEKDGLAAVEKYVKKELK